MEFNLLIHVSILFFFSFSPAYTLTSIGYEELTRKPNSLLSFQAPTFYFSYIIINNKQSATSERRACIKKSTIKYVHYVNYANFLEMLC